MFGPLTKRGSVSRRRLPAMAASGIAAAGLSVGVLMTNPALAADNHSAHPAHPAKGDSGAASTPPSDSAAQSSSSGPDGGTATPADAHPGKGAKPDGHKPDGHKPDGHRPDGHQPDGTKAANPGTTDSGPTADANTGAGPNTARSDGGSSSATNVGPTAATSGPGPDAKPDPGKDAKPDPGKDAKPDHGKDAKPDPGKDAKDAPAKDKGPKNPDHDKGPKAGTTAAGGCSEDSFLGSATPASGSTVRPGSRIGATYSDEKVISTTLLPTLTLSGPGVDMQLPIDSYQPAKTVLLTAVLPTTGLNSGTYLATLKAWDGDQNKAGGDCGVATWSFVVNAPNPPPVNPTPPVSPTPPVNPAPPATPTPPVNPPSTPPAAPTVPTQVLGVTLTRPTPPAAPTATATPVPLAFTGDETRVLSEGGLLLVAAGSALIARSQRRRFGRSKR